MAGRVWQHLEMNWRQLDGLSRDKTVFVLPVGMVEQHGPHLPVGVDTFGSEALGRMLSQEIIGRKPDWDVVVLPMVHYAAQAIEDYVEDEDYRKPPGSIAVGWETQRDYLTDIGSAVARWGFKYIVQVTAHIEPEQARALEEASMKVSELFGVKMFNYGGIELSKGRRPIEEAAVLERSLPWGMGGHAGVEETEFVMAERPDLVDVNLRKELPSIPQGGFGSAERAAVYANASQLNWEGYFGGPALADWDYAWACRGSGSHVTWFSMQKADDVIRVLEGEEFKRVSWY
jgi:creatinine amidohydrolase